MSGYMLVMFQESVEYDPYLQLVDENEDLEDRQREPTSKELNPKAIGEALDQHAEGANCHQFVGCHLKLAELLHREVGASAKKIMIKIAENGGLHRLL